MYNRLLPLGGLLLLAACHQQPTNQETEMKYPETKRVEASDTFFGVEVKDPYRWLEDDRSAETAAWVKAENAFTNAYLEKIPYREAIKKRLEQVWNYEKLGAPFVEGAYTYYYKNDGLQNQSVLYRRGKDGKEEVFLDPNKMSADGTTSLGSVSFSEDGSLVAYLISEGGSDWRKLIVLDAASKQQVGQTLVDVKFSSAAWKGNEGFFYSSYDKPKGSELSAKTDQHKLYYHKMGTAQKDDQLIYGADTDPKYRYVGGYLSEDSHYLFVSLANATSGNKLIMKDLTKANAPFVVVADKEGTDTQFITNKGSRLYFLTNIEAPNMRLVSAEAAKPSQAEWRDVIPETQNVLSVSTVGDKIFAHYIVDALTNIKEYDYEGRLVKEVQLPGIGTAGGFGGK